jgi:hypothetical protein
LVVLLLVNNNYIYKTGHRVLHANFSTPCFCSDKNIQTIFGTKLEDFLNYRIDYVEKVMKKIFFSIQAYDKETHKIHKTHSINF